MNISHGKHTILFRSGKLFLDSTQIAGEGIEPAKDVVFEFMINKPLVEEQKVGEKDPSILEVNVHDSVSGRSVGPGQR